MRLTSVSSHGPVTKSSAKNSARWGQRLNLAGILTAGATAAILVTATAAYAAPPTFFSVAYGLGGTFTPNGITSGDFNSDGHSDVATVNPSANNVTVKLSFGSTSTFSVGTNDPGAIVSADFSGDGKPDLATANYATDSISILTNNGTGTGFTSSVIALGGSANNPSRIVSADFNGDGKPDLATANTGSSDLTVFNSTSTVGVYTQVLIPLNLPAGGLVAADLDGDGKPDLATSHYKVGSGWRVSLMTNNGSGTAFTISNTSVSRTGYAITAGDYNNDGRTDLAQSEDGYVTVLTKNVGSGYTNASYSTPGILNNSIVTADFNGDGKKDLATGANAASGTPPHVKVFTNNGTGTGFAITNHLTNQSGNTGSPVALTVGSFDCVYGCRTDIATANSPATSPSTYNFSVLWNGGGYPVFW